MNRPRDRKKNWTNVAGSGSVLLMSNATAEDFATRLSLMILGATGALVRVTVSDRVLLIASTEADRDAAAAFVRAQRGFDAGEPFECRGTHRIAFYPITR